MMYLLDLVKDSWDIPSTEQPSVEGEFLLRIATENEAHVTELKD